MDDAIAQWIREGQAGDVNAFERLTAACEAPLFVLLAHLLGTTPDASAVREAAGNVLAAAWHDLGSLRDGQDFPQWLFRRAVKAALRLPATATNTKIDALPGPERAAVRLHFARRADSQEVARLLGCSVSECWALLYDGCRHLERDHSAAGARANTNNLMYRTWLIPYIEETLAPARQAEIEARFAEDAALLVELEQLRRALPNIERTAAPPATLAAPASLWPEMRKRLEGTRPEHARIPPAGVIVCIALAALLLASALQDWHLAERGRQADAKWRHELTIAPRVVFHRSSQAGPRLAANLRARARKVAVERRAWHYMR